MNEVILKIQNLSHSYDDDQLSLKKINLLVNKGERLSIQGPSGCGKSTLLRLIAGLEEPNEGQIFINEEEVSSPGFSVPPEKRQIGMVVQDKALFPHLSIYENICFGIKKNTNKEQIALDLLNLFKIEELKNKFPHQISGGEKQRVALARSMAPNPNFIMLDEAFSALDSDLKVSIYDEVLEIFQGKNITVILVTHDTEEAKILSTRQLNMDNGELL
ncbi:MAG: ABC transporter ATP-binding protein [Gammaproteobacteria bacterium]|jgi:iron(III) transport system ATP-binding protein|tara:strand:+ start:405 stop:1055 length:651 start_codon:yes stop_codon:yes gene_type:complete